MRITIPLFPLDTVLFPGGALPLRVFEPRYLDMVSQCLKTECGIGVVLIKEGKEIGNAARTHEVGTLSRISYWHKRSDGLLGMTLLGEKRFRIISTQVKPDQLILAEVELLDDVPSHPLAEKNKHIADFLQQIISQLEPPYSTMKTKFDDADWVGARLVELLPIDLDEKQRLLMINDPDERLNEVEALLNEMEIW